MFEYLEGIVAYKKLEYIALDINGVGYKIFISLREYENLVVGNKYKLYIYNYIREDANKLIGFLNKNDRVLFEKLLNVKGIGLSLALAILSTFSSSKIVELIRNEDFSSLKKVPKLGEKKAQLIIIDLKNKLTKLECSYEEGTIINCNNNIMLEDITMALEALGYSKKEIDKILDKVELNRYSNIEEAIKNILNKIRMEG